MLIESAALKPRPKTLTSHLPLLLLMLLLLLPLPIANRGQQSRLANETTTTTCCRHLQRGLLQQINEFRLSLCRERVVGMLRTHLVHLGRF